MGVYIDTTEVDWWLDLPAIHLDGLQWPFMHWFLSYNWACVKWLTNLNDSLLIDKQRWQLGEMHLEGYWNQSTFAL